MSRFFHKTFILLSLFLSLSSVLLAYTSEDYYKAGLNLYQKKNYEQAVRYFDAAISIDPNNLLALQGSANSYYLLGQYAPALADYQKIQAAHPTDQMAQFIQGLQARVGKYAAPGSNPVEQGKALYQSKQYQAAAPYFQQAIQQAPNDYVPYYWQAMNSLMMGDKKDAVLNFTMVDRKRPNQAVKNYIQKLWPLLTPPEQQWVYEQVARLSPAPAETTQVASKPGIRLEPSFVFMNMTDFNAEGSAGKTLFGQLLNNDPGLIYTALVPSAYANITIEPVFPLLPNLELGVPLSYGPVGSFTETLTSSVYGNQTTSQSFTAFSAGLNARYFLTPGSVRFFVAGGPLVVDLNDSMSVQASSISYTANLTGLGFGGQLQLGVDWHFDNIVITPLIGYQLLSVGTLSGTTTALTGQVTEMYNANSGASYPLFVLTTDPAAMPNGWRPAQVDLSGPYAGLSAGVYF